MFIFLLREMIWQSRFSKLDGVVWHVRWNNTLCLIVLPIMVIITLDLPWSAKNLVTEILLTMSEKADEELRSSGASLLKFLDAFQADLKGFECRISGKYIRIRSETKAEFRLCDLAWHQYGKYALHPLVFSYGCTLPLICIYKYPDSFKDHRLYHHLLQRGFYRLNSMMHKDFSLPWHRIWAPTAFL